MQTKIPPPIVTLIFGLAIYFSRELFPVFEFKHSNLMALIFLFLGLFLLFSAANLFKKNKTTINPINPMQASVLVTKGVFKVSRNPMYLGMALILCSVAIIFNIIGGIFLVILFCIYITRYQIIPEENAMKEIFANDFEDYINLTRRWI